MSQKPTTTSLPRNASEEVRTRAIDASLRANSELMLGNSISIGKNLDVEVKDIDVNVPDPWVGITSFSNGWITDKTPVRYARFYNGLVYITGSLKAGVIGSGAFQIPMSVSPFEEMRFPCVSNGAFGSLNVLANGLVVPETGVNTDFWFHVCFMPANNRHEPLSCFPIDVKTRFKQPPMAVLAIKNTNESASVVQPQNVALMPTWMFKDGSIQVLDIPGLEYGVNQKVKLLIIGG